MKNKLRDYSINCEIETHNQIKRCIQNSFVIEAVLLPDSHKGYVAPIGSVIKTKKYIIPSWVGYDIGCGVKATEIKFKSNDIINRFIKNRNKIIKSIINNIKIGKGIYNEKRDILAENLEKLNRLLKEFKNNKDYNKNDYNLFKQSSIKNLGTLGSGNHFIELGIENLFEKSIWIIVHTGSRRVGQKIAERYMKLAKQINKKKVENKENNKINRNNEKESLEETYPLEYENKFGKDYINAHNFCIEFSKLNRTEITNKIINIILKELNININELKIYERIDKPHNFIEIEINNKPNEKIFIHRKGAMSLKRDEKGIIPGNIKEGTFIVKGKGDPNFLNSSSHGAGRIMSRKEAKKKINEKEVKKVLENISYNKINVDEAPQAYKDIYIVLEKQRDNIEIIKHIKPLINIKG